MVLPVNHAPGDAILASDINAVATAANTNTTNITANTTNITANTTATTANTTATTANTTAIATNTTNITANTTAIATNTTNITANATATTANTTAIATNATNITANTTATTANTTAIATNATNITANTTATTANTTALANIGGVATNTSVTGAQNITVATGGGDQTYVWTLTGNTSLTLSGGTAGKASTIQLEIHQDATGGRSLSLPINIAWAGQIPPILNLGVGKFDILQMTTYDGGTTYTGTLIASAVQPVTVPAAPVSAYLQASTAQIILSATDSSNGGYPITTHNIYRSITSGAETLIASGVTLPYTDTGRTNGTQYWYQTTAVNAIGEGARSAEVGARAGHYLNVPAASGISTPTNVNQSPGVSGTVDLRAQVSMSNWVPGANAFIINKWGATASNNQYALYIDVAGKLNAAWYNPGGAFQGLPSSIALPFLANATRWIRGLMAPASGTCTYYTSDDATTWTQLGTTITGLTTTGVQAAASPYALFLGQTSAGTAQWTGKIYQALVAIAGTTVANVDFTQQTAGTGPFTGVTSETWTVNGSSTVI